MFVCVQVHMCVHGTWRDEVDTLTEILLGWPASESPSTETLGSQAHVTMVPGFLYVVWGLVSSFHAYKANTLLFELLSFLPR